MEKRRLGGDGPDLSVVGLGCNNLGMKLDAAASSAVVNAALDAGITHFDTAESYGRGKSEEFLGAALGQRRDDVVIASKYSRRPSDEPYSPGVLAKRIVEGCESSLVRLGTDRIDLYYQHYPDAEAPVDEALEALDQLVQQGKVLHLASSNLSGEQITEAQSRAVALGLNRFVGTQIEWNLLERGVERDVVPSALAASNGIVPYFPLASGMLTGKYKRGQDLPKGSRLDTMDYFKSVLTDENFARVESLTDFAEQRGHTIIELAVAWLAAQDGVASVICGATSPRQVEVNAAAAQWQISADDLAALP